MTTIDKLKKYNSLLLKYSLLAKNKRPNGYKTVVYINRLEKEIEKLNKKIESLKNELREK
jgi:hypothetical protein